MARYIHQVRYNKEPQFSDSDWMIFSRAIRTLLYRRIKTLRRAGQIQLCRLPYFNLALQEAVKSMGCDTENKRDKTEEQLATTVQEFLSLREVI